MYLASHYSYNNHAIILYIAAIICNFILLQAISVTNNINDPIQVSEKQALLNFKNGITHDPIGILSSWRSSESSLPCSGNWTGVTCGVINGTPRVKSLDLNDSNLTGTINGPSLSNLTYLTYFNLSINSFFGHIPPQLGSLACLAILDFKRNVLSGSIPPELGNCSSLKWLDISNNLNISGTIPPFIGQLTNLNTLQLHDLPNLTGSIPPQLGNLTNLVDLYFGGSGLTGSLPAELGNLIKLEQLFLYGNPFSGTLPPQLGKLKNLQYLYLFINQIHGPIPQELGNLSSIQYMYIMMCRIEGTIPPELGKLTKLKELDLSMNQLQGNIPLELAQLKNLEKLKLFRNNFSGSIPSEFINFEYLQGFYAQYNSLTGQIPPEFGQLKYLQDIQIHFNKLTGPLPSELGKLQNLTILVVEANQLSGSIPRELGNLTNLALLYVGNNLFSGYLPAELGNLKGLQYLLVSGNTLRGPIPPTLGQLTELVFLDLSRNQFSGTIPLELYNCTKLQYMKLGNNFYLQGDLPDRFDVFEDLHTLTVTHNNLTGSLPKFFANHSSLVVFDFSHNKFEGYLPDSWSQLDNLRILSVGYNDLQGDLPAWLWNLNQLQVLELSNNKFTGNIPRELGQMEGFQYNKSDQIENKTLWNDDADFDLKGTQVYYKYILKLVISLDLSGNQLTGSIPNEIGSMTGLFNLNHSNNQLTGPIPITLDSMLTLESLDLSNNQLTGPIPSQLENLTSLSFLNLSNNQLSGHIPTGHQFNTFTNQSYLGNKDLCGSPLTLQCKQNSSITTTKHNNISKIIPIVASVFGFISLLVILLATFYAAKRKLYCFKFYKYRVEVFDKRMTLSEKELSRATGGYSDAYIVGRGGFSIVYKCKLRNGMVVAVKRINLETHPEAERSFSVEVTALGKIRHRNLVRILGTMTTKGFKSLILEYVPNGNLEMHLYKEKCELNWNHRFNIALKVAQGLLYLHNDTGFGQVLHCDLKPSNILLDEDLEPHISDFGIAKLISTERDITASTHALKGSIGYIAPEYAYGERLTNKVDVFSYGVVILELMTRKRPTSGDFDGSKSLGAWAQAALLQGTWIQVIDPILLSDTNADEQQIHEVLKIAVNCVEESPRDRPSMKDVVDALLQILKKNKVVSEMNHSAINLHGSNFDQSKENTNDASQSVQDVTSSISQS